MKQFFVKLKQFVNTFAGWPVVRFFVNSDKISMLSLKCLLLLVIPYAYLMLCGLVFDQLLKWYMMTTFIFVSLCILTGLSLFLIALALTRFFRKSSH